MHPGGREQVVLVETVEQEESIANVVEQVEDLIPMVQTAMVVPLVEDLTYLVEQVARLTTLEVTAVAVARIV
jgi:hypothetical protein